MTKKQNALIGLCGMLAMMGALYLLVLSGMGALLWTVIGQITFPMPVKIFTGVLTALIFIGICCIGTSTVYTLFEEYHWRLQEDKHDL